MTMDSEKLILELNFRNDLIDERQKNSYFKNSKMFDLVPETIVDKRTLLMVEIHDLFKALDHTRTMVGSARLFHSLMNPSESIELIHAKQESLMEIEANDKLRNAIVDYLEIFRANEKNLFKVINAHMLPLLAYKDHKHAMKAVAVMLKAADAIPQPDTIYIDSLIKNILSFGGSPVSCLCRQPTFRTIYGIKAKSEKSFFTPSWRFRPSRISGGSIWPALPCIAGGLGWLTGYMDPAVAQSIIILTCGGIFVGVLYGVLAKPMIDYESAILPIRKRFIDSNRFNSAIESVAYIDELVSFMNYRKAMPHPTVIPEIENSPSHFFTATGLRNPIKALSDPQFVGNDAHLDRAKVTFITGPNSGGKTTYCKTIVQSQILGQIGAPVVAESAKMSICDRIFYQAPSFDSLNDPEGRFGTELAVTKNIFFKVTPKSLAILDEIAEGTTTHEKMTLSVDILNGFSAKGNNTMLVTHSYELVERFKEQGIGQYLQVEFKGEHPSHRMIEGISRDSHALRVARKIGFAPEDIEQHLMEQGYR
ncbi:MAG: DNA mismatch repair protein MutS [Deltaproteobacteria bacterium]